MSALRHGRIEKTIAAAIAAAIAPDRSGYRSSVLITSSGLADDLFNPHIENYGPDYKNYRPTPAQRKTVTRAMHSFCRKHQQYALTGGQGRRELYLFDTADPVSVMWAKMKAERKRRGEHIPRSAAVAALNHEIETG